MTTRVQFTAANKFQQHLDGITGTVVEGGERAVIVEQDRNGRPVVLPVKQLSTI